MSDTLPSTDRYVGPIIDRLRQSRKPAVVATPPKAKPVTDEQLLAVVEELVGEIHYLHRIVREQDKKLYQLDSRLWTFKNVGPLGRLFSAKWWIE